MTFEQIEEILTATSSGLWEYHIPSDRLSISTSLLKLLGYTNGNQPQDRHRWQELIHPLDRTHLLKTYASHAALNDNFEMQFRMLTHDGNYIWFSSHIKIVERTANHQPAFLTGININITERKKIEELEKEAMKNLRLVEGFLRISFSSYSIFDFLTQKIVKSQWRVMQGLGYDDEEFQTVSERFFQKILHPEDAWIIENHIAKMRQSKQDQVLECVFRLKSKSGDYHWIALRDSVLQWNKNGDICQVVGTILDVTRYKNIKIQLDENLDKLATLSYRNSHELRAPVATILGLVSLIRYELQTEGSIQELIDILENTIVKMDTVIREFGKALL